MIIFRLMGRVAFTALGWSTLSRTAYRPGGQAAVEAHSSPRPICHALSPMLPVLLPHFPASLQGWATCSYLESIEADHALAMRNVVVSENLLPLLQKH